MLACVRPEARRQSGLDENRTDAVKDVLIEALHDAVCLRHPWLCRLRHDFEVLEGATDFSRPVRVQPVYLPVADEMPQSGLRVVGVLRGRGVHVPKTTVHVLHGERALSAGHAEHALLFRCDVVGREVLSPLLELTSVGTAEFLHVPHLPAGAGLAVGIARLVCKHVLFAHRLHLQSVSSLRWQHCFGFVPVKPFRVIGVGVDLDDLNLQAVTWVRCWRRRHIHLLARPRRVRGPRPTGLARRTSGAVRARGP